MPRRRAHQGPGQRVSHAGGALIGYNTSNRNQTRMWSTLMAQNAAAVNALWEEEDRDAFDYYCRQPGTRINAIMTKIEQGESTEAIAVWLLWKEYRQKPGEKLETVQRLRDMECVVLVHEKEYRRHEEMKAARAAGGEVWNAWLAAENERIALASTDHYDKIKEMWISGMTAGQIAKKLGMGYATVRRVCDAAVSHRAERQANIAKREAEKNGVHN